MYSTMRRNAKRYQPKHLKKEKHFSLKRKDYIQALVLSLSIFVVSLSCFVYFSMANTTIPEEVTAELTPSKSISTTTYIEELVMVNDTMPARINLEAAMIHYDAYMGNKSEQTKKEPIEEETETSETLESQLGNNIITIGSSTLTKHELPDRYYPGVDYSSFQPYMCYSAVTNKSAPAYAVVHSTDCYTDEYGLRRYKTDPDQFTINNQDDFVIALGTFYKPKGVVGNRYLIVTSNGSYTAITGDEKSDSHTDNMHMFTLHSGGNRAGMIEWIVDMDNLNNDILRSGTVTIGGPEVLQGEILYIYEITE